MQRAEHIRFFSVVYISTPKRSDIQRCVVIRIQNINFTVLICTLKNLISAFTNMLTARTSLTCVRRFYDNQLNPIKQRLVFKERTQLPEVPTSKFCSKLFVSAFRCKPDIGKVFDSNSFSLFLCGFHKGFTNSVIQDDSRCSFLATKPFQKSFGTSRAFALNRATNLLSFFSVLVNPISRVFGIIRSRNNVCQTEIHTDKLLDVINIFFGNINGLEKVKLSFLVNQICFAFNVRQISRIVANKLNLLATTNTPQGNNVICLVSHNTTVISDTSKWSKSTFGFLVKFVGISNLCDSTNQTLRRKFKHCLVSVVNFVVEFKIIEDAFRPSNVRNSITNGICFLYGVKEQIHLFVSRKKFDFQRQFHNTNITNSSDIRRYYLTKGITAFLPSALRDQWVSAVLI